MRRNEHDHASLPRATAAGLPPAAAAALFMLGATACIAGTTLLAKVLGRPEAGTSLHPLQISFGRFFFAWIAIALAVAVLRPPLARPAWGTHAARTACGWAGASLMFASVAYIALPDATAISFLSPVFTLALAAPFLGERVGPWRWGAAAVALLGALVLLRPGAGVLAFGAVLALGAALAMGLEAIFIKRLSRAEAPMQILLVNNSMGLVIATLAVIAFWQAPTAAQWGALAGIGGLMICGQALYLQALRRADASYVAPLFYLTLVFATLYDFWLFGALPDGTSIAGALLLVGGAATLAWREGRRNPLPPAALPR